MKQNFYTDQHITHPTITDMRVTKKNTFFTRFKFKPQGSTLREAEGTVVRMWKSCGHTWRGVLRAQRLGEEGSHTWAALSLRTQLGFCRTLRINSYERKVTC